MHSAPELLLRYPAMAHLLNELVQKWDEAVFVALSPDLRFAFTHFKPKETAAFAEQIAQINGVSSMQIAHYSTEMSQEAAKPQGVQLNQQLNFLIAEQQLESWLAGTEQGRPVMTSHQDADSAARWRLILGRYSDRALNQAQLDHEQPRLKADTGLFV